MTKAEIVAAAGKLNSTHDLLILLNRIKMDELGDKGHPFIMPHLNYFINPARNKKSYKTFRIPKKSGGVRIISAPRALLKSFLTYTNILLQSFYEAPDYITGFVPARSVVDNAERHVGMNYVFNTDLKDFFPSISKSRVWATLKHYPFRFNDTIADAIAGLCCSEVLLDGEKRIALPQGSPCSPILTNIVCRNLDYQLHKLAQKYHVRYSRYADDITFSSNRNVFQKDGEFLSEMRAVITTQNFTINEKKTRLQKKSQRQEVTGLIVSDRVNVTRSYVRWIDNLLYIWERYGEQEANMCFLRHYTPKQNLHKSRPNMRSVVYGKLLYLKMVKGVDSEVWRRLQRRFNTLCSKEQPDQIETIKYRYTLSGFENKTGTKIDYHVDDKGVLHCSFTLNEKKTGITMSKYARTRITNLLAKGDKDQLDKFIARCFLLYYEEGSSGFWRIERKRSYNNQVETIVLDLTNLSSEETLYTQQPITTIEETKGDLNPDETKKNTDEILSELISSGFDLNILDKWDKIKNN